MKTFFKAFFTTIILIIILALGGFAAYYYFFEGEDADKIDEGGENLQFLMLGVDSLDSKKADNARSDTIMVVNLDGKTGKVNIISIPRDT